MREILNVVRTKITNAAEVTLVVTKQLNAEELEWLNKNGITEFDNIEIDIETGEINMAVSYIDLNVKEGLDYEER